jgi:hypothetical protein
MRAEEARTPQYGGNERGLAVPEPLPWQCLLLLKPRGWRSQTSDAICHGRAKGAANILVQHRVPFRASCVAGADGEGDRVHAEGHRPERQTQGDPRAIRMRTADRLCDHQLHMQTADTYK